jgi:hypothetical protein
MRRFCQWHNLPATGPAPAGVSRPEGSKGSTSRGADISGVRCAATWQRQAQRPRQCHDQAVKNGAPGRLKSRRESGQAKFLAPLASLAADGTRVGLVKDGWRLAANEPRSDCSRPSSDTLRASEGVRGSLPHSPASLTSLLRHTRQAVWGEHLGVTTSQEQRCAAISCVDIGCALVPGPEHPSQHGRPCWHPRLAIGELGLRHGSTSCAPLSDGGCEAGQRCGRRRRLRCRPPGSIRSLRRRKNGHLRPQPAMRHLNCLAS